MTHIWMSDLGCVGPIDAIIGGSGVGGFAFVLLVTSVIMCRHRWYIHCCWCFLLRGRLCQRRNQECLSECTYDAFVHIQPWRPEVGHIAFIARTWIQRQHKTVQVCIIATGFAGPDMADNIMAFVCPESQRYYNRWKGLICPTEYMYVLKIFILRCNWTQMQKGNSNQQCTPTLLSLSSFDTIWAATLPKVAVLLAIRYRPQHSKLYEISLAIDCHFEWRHLVNKKSRIVDSQWNPKNAIVSSFVSCLAIFKQSDEQNLGHLNGYGP